MGSDQDDELDAVHLAAQLERVEGLLESACRALAEAGQLDLLPENVYEWHEALLERRASHAKKMRHKNDALRASALSKLTREEIEALKEGL